jgi:hypothetical protein
VAFVEERVSVVWILNLEHTRQLGVHISVHIICMYNAKNSVKSATRFIHLPVDKEQQTLLGDLTKLRKLTVNYVVFAVCPSLSVE